MKDQYDFSKAECGKFHRPDAQLNVPVYLDADVREFVTHIAEKRHIDISQIVNDLLRSSIESSER